MNDSGPVGVLLLFAVIYAWLAWTVASMLAKRFRRFRVATLLLVMALISVVLGLIINVMR
jgi:predicted PurR-regulated permease PerM